MKKMILFISLLLMPISALAYSDYVIPGGGTIGVSVSTDGVLVIGFYKVDGKFNKGDNELQTGDYITKINGEDASSIKKLTSLLEKYSDKKEVTLTFTRDDKELTTKFKIIKDDDKLKTGLYVKDSIKGTGSISFINPETKTFGGLGHEILENNTNKEVDIASGFIFFNTITGIEKSRPGVAGSKIAEFDESKVLGTITKNTKYGIFGKYEDTIDDQELLEVGMPKIGEAQIRTVISGTEIETFPIEITRLNETSKTKNITFRLASDELINKTGGVVQGMSGSPIIQNNKIVGVLTHVIVDNPITGYGTFITTMLEESEK